MTTDPSADLLKAQRLAVYAEALWAASAIVLTEHERDGEPSDLAYKLLASAVGRYEAVRKELAL